MMLIFGDFGGEFGFLASGINDFGCFTYPATMRFKSMVLFLSHFAPFVVLDFEPGLLSPSKLSSIHHSIRDIISPERSSDVGASHG